MGEIESVGQAYEDMQVRSGDLHGQLALQTGLLGCRKVVVVSCCCCRCRSCRCCRQGTATLGFGCACAIMLIAFCHRAAHLLLQAQNQRLLTSLAQRDEDASKMLQQVLRTAGSRDHHCSYRLCSLWQRPALLLPGCADLRLLLPSMLCRPPQRHRSGSSWRRSGRMLRLLQSRRSRRSSWRSSARWSLRRGCR